MGGVVLAMIKTAPNLDINEFLKLDEPSILYDDSQKYMDEYITSERRINISINKVPIILKDAFISIEDSRFDTHPGIDLKRLGGAIFNDIKIKINGSGESLQGASTITQQLVKYRMFLEDSMENRTSIKRKVQEMSLVSTARESFDQTPNFRGLYEHYFSRRKCSWCRSSLTAIFW